MTGSDVGGLVLTCFIGVVLVALTLGIRDLIMADFLSGTIRLLDALLTAACIACGVGLVLGLATMIPGVNV